MPDVYLKFTSVQSAVTEGRRVIPEIYCHNGSPRDVSIQCIDYADKPFPLTDVQQISVWMGSDFYDDAIEYERYDSFFNSYIGDPAGVERTDLITITDAANGQMTLHLTDTELALFPSNNENSMIEFMVSFETAVFKDWIHIYVAPTGG